MESKNEESPSWEEVIRCASYDDLKGILPREALNPSGKYTYVNPAYLRKAAGIALVRGRVILSQLEREIESNKPVWRSLDDPEASKRLIEQFLSSRPKVSHGTLADTPILTDISYLEPDTEKKYNCLKKVCGALEKMAQSGTFDNQAIGVYFQGVYDGLQSQ